MAKLIHLALYGSTTILRGFCEDCNRMALIVDENIQCCNRQVEIPSGLLEQKRMSSSASNRATPSARHRKQQLIDQDYRCFYCEQAFGSVVEYKKRPATLLIRWDHVTPFAYSQNNHDSNFVAACAQCNAWKSDLMFQTIDEVKIYVQEKWAQTRASPKTELPRVRSDVYSEEAQSEISQPQLRVQALGESSPQANERRIRRGASRKPREKRLSKNAASLAKEHRHCLYCDNEFIPVREWQKFCSRYCGTSHWQENQMLQCPHCDHVFTVSRNNSTFQAKENQNATITNANK